MKDFLARLRFLFTGHCGGGCGWDKKFGCFIPEADCPVHDYWPFL